MITLKISRHLGAWGIHACSWFSPEHGEGANVGLFHCDHLALVPKHTLEWGRHNHTQVTSVQAEESIYFRVSITFTRKYNNIRNTCNVMGLVILSGYCHFHGLLGLCKALSKLEKFHSHCKEVSYWAVIGFCCTSTNILTYSWYRCLTVTYICR